MEAVTSAPLRHRAETSIAALRAVLVCFVAIAALGASLVRAQSNADRAFLAWAVQTEIQQQDMGRIAERRAQTTRVRDLGDYLVQRHQQAQRRLENVANQLGEALSNKLSATHLRVQSRFRSIAAASFDGAFIDHEIGDYRYFLRNFEAAARTGSPPVRQFAASEIENLRQDQTKIMGLAVETH
jgi:putative membrane protein